MTNATSAEAFSQRFASSFCGGVLEEVLNLYWPQAVLLGPQGEQHRGVGAIAQVLRPLLTAKLQMTLSTLSMVEADGVAMVRNEFQLLKGSRCLWSSVSVEVLRRGPDGEWRLLIDDPYGRA
jgi:ketosteroid isomerase-like protein